MAKQPNLSHLSTTSRGWAKQIEADFELESHHMKLLIAAAECLDRIKEAQKHIREHGAIYCDRFGAPRKNPAASIEVDNKAMFCRLVRDLGLDISEEAARPPTITAIHRR